MLHEWIVCSTSGEATAVAAANVQLVEIDVDNTYKCFDQTHLAHFNNCIYNNGLL